MTPCQQGCRLPFPLSFVSSADCKAASQCAFDMIQAGGVSFKGSGIFPGNLNDIMALLPSLPNV